MNINKVRRVLKAQLGLPSLLPNSMQWDSNSLLFVFTNPYLDKLMSSLIGNPFMKSNGIPTVGKFNTSIDDKSVGKSLILPPTVTSGKPVTSLDVGSPTLFVPTQSLPKFTQLQVGNFIGQGADIMSNLIPRDYNGKYSSLQLTGDLIFDSASSAVMAINPLVGGIMKAGGLVSDVLTEYAGMGTDNMTKTDAILGSKLLSLTPMGMINGFFGKRTQDFHADNRTIEQVGGSYGGSVHDINNAVDTANKKYGLFSGGARRRANNGIDDARRQQNRMAGIASEASDRAYLGTSDLNHIRYGLNINGGYDLRYIRAAKLGGLIKRIKKINFHKKGGEIKGVIDLNKEWTPEIIEPIELFKEGGNIERKPEILLEGEKTRTIEELIEYAKLLNPRFIQRLSEAPRGIDFIDNEGNKVRGSHYLASSDNLVFPQILEVDGKLKYFSDWREALDNAIKNKNILEFNSEEEAKLFGEQYKQGWSKFFEVFKEGGKVTDEDRIQILEDIIKYGIEEGILDKDLFEPEIIDSVEEFKEGGKTVDFKDAPLYKEYEKGWPNYSKEKTSKTETLKNVIPDGALHAHKHNMENADGLTLKGIPVVDNNNELQAEIEREEWTMTLKLTKLMEELYNLYNSEETSKSKKDELAIEAGKILVHEILFNTDDRAGLIAKCENGGVIDGSK